MNWPICFSVILYFDEQLSKGRAYSSRSDSETVLSKVTHTEMAG